MTIEWKDVGVGGASWVSLVVFAAACGAPGDAPTRTGGSPTDSIPLVEELRVGGLEGPEELTFGYIYALAPTPDGGFWAFDGQIPLLRKYDSDGDHVMDVGRGGEGPGEYRQITGMKVLDDGRLAAWDPGNMRISFFGEDGSFLESVPVRGAMGSYDGFVISGDGEAYVWALKEGVEFVETPNPESPMTDWARLLEDGSLEPVHTIPLENREGPEYVLSGRGGYYRPFNVQTLHALGPDGSFYEVRNDAYRIRHVHPDGTETFITRDEPRIRLTDDEVREWTIRSESFAERQPDMRERFFPIPEVKPYIRHLAVDSDGRLWVSRYTEAVYVPYTDEEAADRAAQDLPSYNWRDRLRWDVYAPDDTYLGAVTLPSRTSFMDASGGTVWGIQAGPYREDYVLRLRMER